MGKVNRWWYDDNGDLRWTSPLAEVDVPASAAYDLWDRPEWGDPIFDEFRTEEDLDEW